MQHPLRKRGTLKPERQKIIININMLEAQIFEKFFGKKLPVFTLIWHTFCLYVLKIPYPLYINKYQHFVKDQIPF